MHTPEIRKDLSPATVNTSMVTLLPTLFGILVPAAVLGWVRSDLCPELLGPLTGSAGSPAGREAFGAGLHLSPSPSPDPGFKDHLLHCDCQIALTFCWAQELLELCRSRPFPPGSALDHQTCCTCHSPRLTPTSNRWVRGHWVWPQSQTSQQDSLLHEPG